MLARFVGIFVGPGNDTADLRKNWIDLPWEGHTGTARGVGEVWMMPTVN